MAREAATVSRGLDAPRDAVALVLADPRAYDGVVVGSWRIRWFDPRWPEPGSRFHHTLGSGRSPCATSPRSSTRTCPVRPLLVHLRPLGSAEVVFRLTADGDARTRAEMTETPVSAVLALSWLPPAIALARWLNDQVLARLGDVRRWAGAIDGPRRPGGRPGADTAAPWRSTPGGVRPTGDSSPTTHQGGGRGRGDRRGPERARCR
jgi:hypothetical protein